jgi:arginyl-tRNA synthetase
MIEEKLTQQIQDALGALGLPELDFVVEHPTDELHGDYSTNVALVIGKGEGRNPREVAEEIKQSLESMGENEDIEKIEIAGPGFINFYLSKDFLLEEINAIKSAGKSYGSNEDGKGKKVIVEFSSPNIAKPFTVGHLRSTIIGDAIANLFEASGWEVMRDNHLGDWGTQFGKQIYAIKTWGDENKSDYTVSELVNLYVKFHDEAEKDESLNDKAREWFKKLEDGDGEARGLWQKCVDWSWVEFDKIYHKLGVSFSNELDNGRGLGESFFEDKMGGVLEELEGKEWYGEGKEGAKMVFFPEEKYPPAMIMKKDGATLYVTRDLATDKYRKEEFNPNLIVNEVGMEQKLYFAQLFEIEKMLGWFEDGQRVHVGHGLYRFSEGKMSTRKGNVIWLEDVLDEATKRAASLSKDGVIDQASRVGIGALKWNDLKGEVKRNIVFDWDEVLSMKGNSGPYMQYTVVRARSILEGNQVDEVTDYNQWNEEELSLASWVYRYPEVIREATSKYAPHLVATYIFELAQRFNGFYNKHSVLSADNDELKQFRLVLTSVVVQVIENGLGVLGIGVPDKM